MRCQTSISALLAAGVALGCGSHDDEGPGSAAGQPGAGAGMASAGATSDGGRINVGGAFGHAGVTDTGGGHAGATATVGSSGNATGGAGAGGAGGTGGTGASGGRAGSGGAATCQLPLAAGDHSKLAAMERVETYSVSGTTAQQLRQSINANRGHEYDALTNWNITWSYQNCASPVWTVSLDIVYDLPRWDAPPSANEALSASWDRYLDALNCHEYGHGKLGLECANGIYDALAALTSTGDCSALSTAASSTFQALFEQCKTRQAAYDTETMHGATMGAVFPPPN
ncbi:MAG TPA: DUF922 domain-containing protein [Polyangiaceae bacterium]|nr:DUF922 domain-containing protein [Polyangiaceae bacterium]